MTSQFRLIQLSFFKCHLSHFLIIIRRYAFAFLKYNAFLIDCQAFCVRFSQIPGMDLQNASAGIIMELSEGEYA